MDTKFKHKFRSESTRLSSWDYGSNGNYFITICTDQKTPYFGIITKSSQLNATVIGVYTKKCWESIPAHFPFVELEAYILMPDHLHGILCFRKNTPTDRSPNQFGPQSQNLASVIRSFKGAVKRFANKQSINFQWQSSYFDKIIRSDRELEQIREYIMNNPARSRRDR
jgi:putative transposase